MPEPELDAFERLIQLPDPELQEQIMLGTGPSDAEFGSWIARIRAYHGIGQERSTAKSGA